MRWTGLLITAFARAARSVWAAARRWPKVALISLAMIVLFLPLAVDLFFAIPWPLRKAGGWLLFLGLLAGCAARIWRIDPSDDAPTAVVLGAGGWTCWIPPLACAVMAVPYLAGPDNLGVGDWDYYLSKFEAVRRSILVWRQFPWWDPWCRGGFPLAANPQCGVIGVATPLVLLLGTSSGMRVTQLACLLIATEGARRLASLWLREPLAAVCAGLIYGINGGVLALAVAGYYLPMSFCSLPWLLYHAFRLDRRRADGILLGFWLAFTALNGIHYFSVYAVLILAVVWLRGARSRSGPARARFLLHSALAGGVLLALAGWRLATTGLVYRDFPRLYHSAHDIGPWSILMYLLARPSAADLARMEIPEYWETLWYVGPVVVALATISLARGWRWWHTLAAACVWLAAGAEAWYQPSYWLAHFPPFATMHMVTRWRYPAMLGFALAASDVLAGWRLGDKPALRRLAALAVIAIAADYVLLGCQVLHVGFRVTPSESRFPGPPAPELIQVRDGPGFAAIQRGYGVIRLQEPILGYDMTAPTARLWRGHPDYVGEWWTSDAPLHPLSWSPNRVVLQAQPGQAVSINQNPGSWWVVNGRRAFPDRRSAEIERPFVVRADSRGRVELQIRPLGLELGLALHSVGCAIVGLVLLGSRGW
jgi:hypothetical protein